LGVGSSGDLRGLQVGSTSGPKGVGSVGEPKVVRVWVRVWIQKLWGLGFVPGPKGAGSVSRPKVVGVWVVAGAKGVGACSDPGGLGDGSISEPKGVGSVSRPKLVGVLLRPDLKGLCLSVSILRGVGSLSGPKRVGVWVLRSTNTWGVGSNGVGTQGGWLMGSCLDPRGLGPCPDPIGLGFASVVGPKGVGDGAMSEP
jgi:hypothetical protein